MKMIHRQYDGKISHISRSSYKQHIDSSKPVFGDCDHLTNRMIIMFTPEVHKSELWRYRAKLFTDLPVCSPITMAASNFFPIC